METNKITQAAKLRCATHTLAEQLQLFRDMEREAIIGESADRIIRDAEEISEPVITKDGE
jgi:hypothetical protein